MNESENPQPPPGAGGDPRLVYCRRVGRRLPVGEHARCPYCHGGEERVEDGAHDRFCDYREGDDPIHYGFPGDGSRESAG